MEEYIDSAEVNRRIFSAVDEMRDSVLGTDHDLTDVEVNACGRVLMNIKVAIDAFEKDKKRGGYTIRMAKDIMFLMLCLSGRSMDGNSTRTINLSEVLEIAKKESHLEVPIIKKEV